VPPVPGMLRHREPWLFVAIGAAVAVLGHVLPAMLVAAGLLAAFANAVQFVVTLQLSFLANDRLTWGVAGR
jgi:putative flippase GtrA